MKKKGNKKMPILRQEIIDNPIPTSLFFNKIPVCTHLEVFLFIVKFHPQYTQMTEQLHSTINKDVGMGISMISCLSIGIFLFPFFFMT